MSKRLTKPRMRARRPERRSVVITATALAFVLLVAAAVALGPGVPDSNDSGRQAENGLVAVERANADDAEAVGASIEVPQLVGMPVDEAKLMLTTAGLVVTFRESGEPVAPGSARVVEGQQPQNGALVAHGASVFLDVRPASSVDATDQATKPKRRFVVCIDPGHQSTADDSPEPVGPKSKKMKAKISAGVTGVKTGMSEYEIALQLSMNLKRHLEDRGVEVVMTRSTNDVNLSNAERASVANTAKASLFLRIHGGGSPDSETAGVSTLYPSSNKWTKPITVRSRRAAEAIHHALALGTGAPDRGLRSDGNQAGFNWSRVPAVLVECGMMSNPVEDRLLASPQYQDRVAQGIAEGVLTYLEAEEAR